MKKYICLIAVLILLGTNSSLAQSDTVCAGANNKIYNVNPSIGSTYRWSLKSGLGTINTIAGRSDSITINYGSITGIDTLRLVEIGASGCVSDTAKMRIIILPPVTASISGADSICVNNASFGKLQINFTGLSPWNVIYTDGTTPFIVNGITTSPFILNSTVYGTSGLKTFTITSASGLGNCPANVSGSAIITVFPQPGTLTIIKH